ncbi:hypothetical protein [uncultured Sphaerotilus sp.]|uniref:hypothetical protein n=1 Tax=uncultured Sphaerotilus sp. TaxID=474984 RepID=UPI0030CA4F20
MPQVTTARPPVAPASPCASVRSYPNRQSVRDWLAAQPTGHDPAVLLRQRLPLVAAHLDAEDRISLHRHLWALWSRVDARTRDEATRWLDGRLVPWCQLLDQDWDAPSTWLALAELHLTRTLHWPRAPDHVLALLAAHGQTGSAALPQAQWLGVRARLESDTQTLSAQDADALLQQILASMEAGVAPWTEGIARVFELAVRTGNDALSLETLVQCVQGGGSAAVSPHWFRRWLEGDVSLALSESLQSGWLQPRRMPDPAWRARLLASLHRASARDRMSALHTALGGGDTEPLPDGQAWRMLGALDGCHDLAERGHLPEPPVRALMDSGALAPAAVAALCRSLALQAMDRGDAAGGARALAEARAVHGDAQARVWLAAMLKLLAADAAVDVDALCEALECGSSGGAGGPELVAWERLAVTAAGPLRTLATAMLARALLDGALEAGATDRHRDLCRAESLWRALAADPDHAEEAQRRLTSEPLQQWLPLLAPGPGREHLWVAPAQGAANGELLIVLSCLESRHGYAQVRGLQQALPGHHLLFVNNPEFNWYSGHVLEELDELVRARVLPAFAPERVTCYFGSMGGHGALKLAARFGFRAVVFNAQIDLDLWATCRPNERQRLWAVAAGARFEVPSGEDGPPAALYLAVGSDMADREALTCLIESLRRCRNGQFILEKFADPHHAGLLRRIAQQGIPSFIGQSAGRLAVLRGLPGDPPGMVAVARSQQASFWAQLDAAPALKVEIVWREGRLFIAESTRCGTVPV